MLVQKRQANSSEASPQTDKHFMIYQTYNSIGSGTREQRPFSAEIWGKTLVSMLGW